MKFYGATDSVFGTAGRTGVKFTVNFQGTYRTCILKVGHIKICVLSIRYSARTHYYETHVHVMLRFFDSSSPHQRSSAVV